MTATLSLISICSYNVKSLTRAYLLARVPRKRVLRLKSMMLIV